MRGRGIRQVLETALARAAGAAIGSLPRPAVTGLSRFLGACGYALAPGLRRIGMANLDLVFGGSKSAAEKRRILRMSFRNIALVALDLFWFSRNTREKIGRHVSAGGEMKEGLARTPMICLTGHLGNWEVLGCAIAAGGHSLASVATPLKNPEVDRMLVAMRSAAGQQVIRRRGAVREMLRVLRSGGRVALLLDQNTKIKEGGVFVDFFGVPATVSPAAAALALRSGSCLGFGFCVPDGRGYRVIVPGILNPGDVKGLPEDEAVTELTRRITGIYERVIREHPEGWLWMYKRWKHIKPGDDVGRYPFYAIRPRESDSR
jgi:Kdo2-lipid IVA lauroyltransferase/acyltransferase